jgi:NADH-quinone oxidoreductase subunit J|tara:strand:- start:5375 stop:5986 length:612 start_codon:yes stop_codon:yes gene_type:complete
MFESILFYLFGAITLLSAIMVISSRNPVHSVLFLILAFCGSSGLLILIEAEFMAMIFIVVYVGAIAVLFLFVVMMLNIKISEVIDEIYQYLPVGGLIGIIFLLEVFIIVDNDFVPLLSNGSEASAYVDWSTQIDNVTNLSSLGQVLYTHYAITFLMAGIILLVAMIGAIVLTMQIRTTVRRQHIFQQVSRDADNAIYLVSSNL